MEWVGIVIIGVGLLLVLAGVVFAWQEFKKRQTFGVTKFVDSIRNLIVAIAEAGKEAGSPSLACYAFGAILIFIGGVIAGVAGIV